MPAKNVPEWPSMEFCLHSLSFWASSAGRCVTITGVPIAPACMGSANYWVGGKMPRLSVLDRARAIGQLEAGDQHEEKVSSCCGCIWIFHTLLRSLTLSVN